MAQGSGLRHLPSWNDDSLGTERSQEPKVPVDASAYDDTVVWTKGRFVPRLQKAHDARPGWNLVSVPAIYLGVMAQSLPVLSRDEIRDVAVHLARHQEPDEAWLMPPDSNGAPPTWESRSTLALLALLAWEPVASEEMQGNLAARDKAIAWLQKTVGSETNQETALRSLLGSRAEKSSSELQPEIDKLLLRQNSDGGWIQMPEMLSDAYATGQTHWALSSSGVRPDRAEINGAIAFLVATQFADGSWPMTQRHQPEVEKPRQRNPIPITYFGAAWGTIGLVRCVAPSVDLETRQKEAFEFLREYSDKHEVDAKLAGKPVILVNVRYEVNDEELATLVSMLTAFPELQTLQLKSARLTDAGLKHMRLLPKLRNLTIENALITDAGLVQLQQLSQLESLNIKGTKATDIGVAAFEQALPGVKITR